MITRTGLSNILMHSAWIAVLIAVTTNGQDFTHGRSAKQRLGIGMSIGEPMGGSVRYPIGESRSLDATIGNSNLGSLHIGMDYLWHLPGVIHSDQVSVAAGFGAIIGIGSRGRQFLFYSDDHLLNAWYRSTEHRVFAALQGVVEFSFAMKNIPLDFYLHVNPVVAISPGLGLDIQPALGMRIYP